MDDQVREHILEHSSPPRKEGRGLLGLSTCWHSQPERWYIWVYSEIGKGTTFKIYFPRAEEAESEAPERTLPLVEDGQGTETSSSSKMKQPCATCLSCPDGARLPGARGERWTRGAASQRAAHRPDRPPAYRRSDAAHERQGALRAVRASRPEMEYCICRAIPITPSLSMGCSSLDLSAAQTLYMEGLLHTIRRVWMLGQHSLYLS